MTVHLAHGIVRSAMLLQTLQSVRLRRLLSFGPESEAVALRPLNVLIGPNASGKSNFIEAIGLLHAAPKDMAPTIREGGSIGAWLWKGEPNAVAEIDVVLSYKEGWNLRHHLAFTELAQRLDIVDERIENEKAARDNERPYFYFGYEAGRPMLNVHPGQEAEPKPRPATTGSGPARRPKPRGPSAERETRWRELRREDISREQSILSQRKDPDQYPEISYLGSRYEAIRLYREWSFGRNSSPRTPAQADLPNTYLEPDARNLGLILNRYRRDIPTKNALIEGLQQVFEGIRDFSVQIEGGTIQIFLEEERWTIPATRLSDGTMRWLALLAVLVDPKPPPLVCIEEPELGLHPDLMPSLARLLTSASERTQLIVTTHSEALVDAFSRTPEVVLVCERRGGSTEMRRLDEEGLAEWLETYSLGELWSKGELGGTRW